MTESLNLAIIFYFYFNIRPDHSDFLIRVTDFFIYVFKNLLA